MIPIDKMGLVRRILQGPQSKMELERMLLEANIPMREKKLLAASIRLKERHGADDDDIQHAFEFCSGNHLLRRNYELELVQRLHIQVRHTTQMERCKMELEQTQLH